MRRAVWCVLAACQGELETPLDAPPLDRPYFDCRVQPVLTQYCAALACHGDAARYFHVFARNRLRVDRAETARNAFLRPAERDHNFAGTLAMVDAEDPERSLLLRKPLEPAAGGFFHGGATLYGEGNVFATTDDPDYQQLARWIAGAKETATCIEPGSDL
jgi:hypothetical protein